MKEIINFTEIDNFINTHEIVIAYFSTEACSVCKALKPKVQQFAENYDKVSFFYSGIDKNPEISGKFMVFSVPTIILFIDGREQNRFARHFSIDELKSKIDRYLELSNM